MSPLALASLAGLLGLAAGSFANVVIHRVPRRESVVRPGSRCPACGTPIAWRDNLPLVSWLLLRGRCRSCRAPIAVRYPLVELAMGLLWFVWRCGWPPRASAERSPPTWRSPSSAWCWP